MVDFHDGGWAVDGSEGGGVLVGRVKQEGLWLIVLVIFPSQLRVNKNASLIENVHSKHNAKLYLLQIFEKPYLLTEIY